MNTKRRRFLRLGMLSMVAIAPVITSSRTAKSDKLINLTSDALELDKNPETIKPLVLSNAQWRQRLSKAEYTILRKAGTERPFSSPLNEEKRDGEFVCAGCGLLLFASSTKYDSGTGWPSFYDGVLKHIETSTDYKLLYPRTEYHCKRCGGHQGHVFKDGPEPTGLRYCNNGAALRFLPI